MAVKTNIDMDEDYARYHPKTVRIRSIADEEKGFIVESFRARLDEIRTGPARNKEKNYEEAYNHAHSICEKLGIKFPE